MHSLRNPEVYILLSQSKGECRATVDSGNHLNLAAFTSTGRYVQRNKVVRARLCKAEPGVLG